MKTITLFIVCSIFIISTNANSQTPAAPEICMVTVDTGSVNNLVYWNKTLYLDVDSFIVYREVNTSLHIYKQVGAVSSNSLSLFTDTTRSIGPNTGDPNTGSSCYKLQIRNTAGNYSALSPFHRTIFIDDAGQGEFTVSVPYSIEGTLSPVNNYMLLCDTVSNDNWTVVDLISNTAASAIDSNFISHSVNARWRLKTGWAITCDPTRAPINTTRSNIRHPSTINGILSLATLESSVIIYPNPAKDNVTIELSALTKNAQLKIVNILGQTVFNETIIASSNKTVKQINTSNFAKGIYTVVLETQTGKLLKKLVVN